MKKTVTALLSAALLCLTACGGGAAPEPAATSAPTPAPTAAPTPTPVPEPTEVPEAYIALTGFWEGRTYTNEPLDLAYRQPETWSHLEDEELSALPGIADGLMTSAEKSGQIRYLLYAVSPEKDKSCSLTAEPLEPGAALTEEDALAAAGDELLPALAAAGMTDVTAEMSTAVLAGTERPCLRVTCAYGETQIHELLFVQIAGEYLAVFNFQTTGEEAPDDLLTAWRSLTEAEPEE